MGLIEQFSISGGDGSPSNAAIILLKEWITPQCSKGNEKPHVSSPLQLIYLGYDFYRGGKLLIGNILPIRATIFTPVNSVQMQLLTISHTFNTTYINY